MFPRLVSLWRNLLRRRQADDDLDAELQAAYDLLVDEQVAAGATRDEARRAATIRLGRVPAIRTAIVTARAGAGLEQSWQDLTFGARVLWRSPGFALTAALSLGAGIGATTTMFTIVNALLLRDLPVAEPWQLIEIGRVTQRGPGFSFSYPAYQRLRDESRVFSGVIALSRETVEGNAGEGSRPAAGRYVSGNFFDTLGIVPLAGRLLSATDDRLEAPGAAAVAVVAHGFWQRQLGGSRSALGQTLRIDAVAFTIVGVLPPSFEDVVVGRAADFFVPLASEPLVDRDSRLREPASSWLAIAGRLRPGMTRRHAHANLEPILTAFLADVAAGNPDARVRNAIRSQRLFLQSARRGLSDVGQNLSSPLLLLMGAVSVVLLIACVNVIALLLARGVTRRREIALRLAIGASRARLIRQLLTESLLLGAAGAAIGLAVAAFGAPLLVQLLSSGETPLTLDVTPDGRVLLFTTLIAIASAALAGVIPAVRTVRRALAPGHADARTPALTRESTRSGRAVVASQVALSLLLVVSSGLLLATLRNIRSVDAGFDASHVLLLKVDPARVGLPHTRLAQYYAAVLAHVRAMPGVQHASLSRVTPVSGGGMERPMIVEGRTADTGGDLVSANRVAGSFFSTFGTPVVLGRDFAASDLTGVHPVAIVNEALARRYFGNETPIGRRILLGDRRPREIVGVVANAKYYSLRDRETATAYSPLEPAEPGELTLAVRTSGAPANFADTLRRRVSSVEATVPLSRVRTLTSQVERSLGTERLLARLLTAFALLSLALASVGLYGVLGYSVERRTNEIGLRLALGATRGGVMRGILRQAAAMVLAGSAIGAPAALLLSRLLGGLLYGVTPANPAVLASSIGILLAVAVASAAAPAWRAARVDPLVALRHE